MPLVFSMTECLPQYSEHQWDSLTQTQLVPFFTKFALGAVFLRPYTFCILAGRVLNRFAKDVGFLDDLLPFIFCEYFIVCCIIATLWYLVLPQFSIHIAFLAEHCNHFNCRWVQSLGDNTSHLSCCHFLGSPAVFSQDLQRDQEARGHRYSIALNLCGVCLQINFFLINAARSPVYSHFSMTLQGLSTVRAMKKEDLALQFFHKYQNEHTQVSIDRVCCLKWLEITIPIYRVGTSTSSPLVGLEWGLTSSVSHCSQLSHLHPYRCQVVSHVSTSV